MTPEQIQKMADGLPPSYIGKDYEEVVTHLAKQHIALQQQVNALAAECAALKGFIDDECYESDSGKMIKCRADDIETPATDACLNSVRAEGIHFAANRMLAAWESGFIDDTPAQVLDITGAVLSALEFLPNASPGEFRRDYADEVRAAIATQLRAGEQGGEHA